VVAAAVRDYADEEVPRQERCQALAVILTHQELARPMLLEAFGRAEGSPRLTYARLLGFLGERQAVPDLVKALGDVPDWDPKILQGKMAEYAHLPTPVDSLILALGYTRDRRALGAILPWLERLDQNVTLSHHRAVALALTEIGDPSAAMKLAELLQQPGMRGHAMTRLEPLYDRQLDRRRRTGPLREIVLARTLYQLGDYEGLGHRILLEYCDDVRGLFARHARQVLGIGGPAPSQRASSLLPMKWGPDSE
jgi:hypothetical protein